MCPEMLTELKSAFAITVHNLSIITHKIFKNPALPRNYTTGITKKKSIGTFGSMYVVRLNLTAGRCLTCSCWKAIDYTAL
jgi:hypothetical protein